MFRNKVSDLLGMSDALIVCIIGSTDTFGRGGMMCGDVIFEGWRVF
jgi:hypothetical protein